MAQLKININGAEIGISKFSIPPAITSYDNLADGYVVISGLDDYTAWQTEFLGRLSEESQSLVTFETI
jgi:hypothetical protein